jgi:hypothetical protein
MTDRACCGPVSFSGPDRRRLALTLERTAAVHWLQRGQAVRRVAEGDPIGSVARALRLSRRRGQRWGEIYRRRRPPEDWLDAPRSGGPRAAPARDEEWGAERRPPDPRTRGHRARTGTTPLRLTPGPPAGGAPVSERSVRRRWHAGGGRWRRPPYLFRGREAAVGSKQGHSAVQSRADNPAPCSGSPTGRGGG